MCRSFAPVDCCSVHESVPPCHHPHALSPTPILLALLSPLYCFVEGGRGEQFLWCGVVGGCVVLLVFVGEIRLDLLRWNIKRNIRTIEDWVGLVGWLECAQSHSSPPPHRPLVLS